MISVAEIEESKWKLSYHFWKANQMVCTSKSAWLLTSKMESSLVSCWIKHWLCIQKKILSFADFDCNEETVCSICKIQRGLFFTLRGLPKKYLPQNRFVLDFYRLESTSQRIEFSGMDGKNLKWNLRQREVRLVGRPGEEFSPFEADVPFGLHEMKLDSSGEISTIKFSNVKWTLSFQFMAENESYLLIFSVWPIWRIYL